VAEQTDRKPIVVVAVIALVVVLIFVLGVAAGGGGTGGGGWRERLGSLGAGGDLTSEDLVLVDGTCDVAGEVIRPQPACAFDVAPDGGRFSLAPVRRATLLAVDSDVRARFAVEGQVIEVDVDAGDTADLTFSRSGGALALACLGAFACEVRLLPPG
jgi:hypothetical protein